MARKRNFTVLKDVMQITCIVEKGQADHIVQAAREAGAQGATVYYARGSGVRERLGLLGVAVEVEKEIIDIIVSSDQADYIFEKMYLAGQLDTPGKGFIYMTPLSKAATFIPSEVIQKVSGREGMA